VPVAGGIAILAALMFGLGAGILALKDAYCEPSTGGGTPTPPDIPVERFGEPIPAR
jgi:hypothetical protein